MLKEPWQKSHSQLPRAESLQDGTSNQTGKQFRHLGHEGRLSWHAHEKDCLLQTTLN